MTADITDSLVPQKPSEYRTFFSLILRNALSGFVVKAGQRVMGDDSFLSLVSGLLSASSLSVLCRKCSPGAECEFSLVLLVSARRRQMGIGDTCCHVQSFIAFILLPVIERSAKFFLRQLSDIYK